MTGARTLSRSLSGYLCGTHSGVLGRRANDRLPLGALAQAHERFVVEAPSNASTLGGPRWQPPEGAGRLAEALREDLDVPAVVELVIFGSQARHSITPYSDVDAILVVTDETAQSPGALRALRPRTLRAQRHVLEYQPMQHHAFEVVTPRLLRAAEPALQLPSTAVAQTAALFGRSVSAIFTPTRPDDARRRFHRMADQLARLPAWPRHPWALHSALSMFELVPAMFLQATGARVEKWRSFELARERFPAAWQPYETLRAVRERWPSHRPLLLRALLRASRNPWLSVDIWRRAPVATPTEIRSLLTPDTLRDLQTLLGLMRAEVPG